MTDYSPSVENVALYKTLRVKFKEGLKLHDECMIRFAKAEIPEIFNKLARKFNEKREHLVLKYVVKAEGGKESTVLSEMSVLIYFVSKMSALKYLFDKPMSTVLSEMSILIYFVSKMSALKYLFDKPMSTVLSEMSDLFCE